jgi:hypothetical protein
MFTVMEPTPDTFSRQIERHLKETNRADEAAALKQQPLLTRLLDRLIVQFVSAPNLRMTEIEQRLRERSSAAERPEGSAPQAFLTPIGSGQQAFIANFEAIASHIGELSMNLQKGRCENENDASEIGRLLNELCADLGRSSPTSAPAGRQTLAQTLEELTSPGELSEAYRQPVFSDRRLRPTNHFLRK